jgi:hypothetical protein
MSQPSAPIIRLCPEHLCELFRQEGLQAKIETNAWREEIRRRRREGSETTFQEFTDYNGNRIVETQELTWIDKATDEERARLHRYITREKSGPSRCDGIGVIMFAGMKLQPAPDTRVNAPAPNVLLRSVLSGI